MRERERVCVRACVLGWYWITLCNNGTTLCIWTISSPELGRPRVVPQNFRPNKIVLREKAVFVFFYAEHYCFLVFLCLSHPFIQLSVHVIVSIP